MTESQAIMDAPASRRVRIGSLLWFLMNVGIQATLLPWHYANCRANSLVTNMGLFTVPLITAMICAIGIAGFFALTRKNWTPRAALASAVAGLATTALVAAAFWIVGYI